MGAVVAPLDFPTYQSWGIQGLLVPLAVPTLTNIDLIPIPSPGNLGIGHTLYSIISLSSNLTGVLSQAAPRCIE